MAKCQCGREMLKANGCRFKRIVVHGKNTKSYDRIKVGDPGDWYEEYVGTPEEKNTRLLWPKSCRKRSLNCWKPTLPRSGAPWIARRR